MMTQSYDSHRMGALQPIKCSLAVINVHAGTSCGHMTACWVDQCDHDLQSFLHFILKKKISIQMNGFT